MLHGILVQKITTKEPNDYQIEAAIAAIYESLGDKEYITIKEAMIEIKNIDITNKLKQNDMLRVLEYMLDVNKNTLFTQINEYYLAYYEYINFKTLINKYLIYNVPLQYIIKKQEFYGLDFFVNENVLVPRVDSEILVAEAIKEIQENDYKTLLDMCCGSGNIGIAIAKNTDIKELILADISHNALNVCNQNLISNNISCNHKMIQSNLFDAINSDAKFDIIVSNPPYIATNEIATLDDIVKNEPKLALDGGDDGLDFYRKISYIAKDFLSDSASLIFEIGMDQAQDVKKILEENDYRDIEIIKDYASKDRVIKCHFRRV